MYKLYVTLIIIILSLLALYYLRKKLQASLSSLHNTLIIIFSISIAGLIFFLMYKDCIFCTNGKCDFVSGVCTCNYGYYGNDCKEFSSCPKDCSKNGLCDPTTGTCTCNQGFKGIDCSQKICPKDCSKNGLCDPTTGTCTCNQGFKGIDCSQKIGMSSITIALIIISILIVLLAIGIVYYILSKPKNPSSKIPSSKNNIDVLIENTKKTLGGKYENYYSNSDNLNKALKNILNHYINSQLKYEDMNKLEMQYALLYLKGMDIDTYINTLSNKFEFIQVQSLTETINNIIKKYIDMPVNYNGKNFVLNNNKYIYFHTIDGSNWEYDDITTALDKINDENTKNIFKSLFRKDLRFINMMNNE
jgi:hypothetical protein